MATGDSNKRTHTGSVRKKSVHRKSGEGEGAKALLEAGRRPDIDPRRHPEVQALEALVERERTRLMAAESLLGAAHIVLDAGEGDDHAPHIPTLLDLAYAFIKASIHALESLNRLKAMSATVENADDS